MATLQTSLQTRPRSLPDRIVRSVLLLHNAEPRALVSLQGSLVLTAIRCVLTYAVIPALAPVVSWVGAVARPVSLAVSVFAAVLAIHSLRRVWLADWRHRWPYTAFILAVLVALGTVITWDVRALLG